MALVRNIPITWSTYFQNKALWPPKNPKYRGRTIIHKNEPSHFDKLYQDIISNILLFVDMEDACNLMHINKFMLFITRNFPWFDTKTCVYDIRLFSHVFPNAQICRLALNSRCMWTPYKYIGEHKIVFEDFSLLNKMKMIILDESMLNYKSSCDLVDGLLSLSNFVIIKIVLKRNIRLCSKHSFFFSFCSKRCIVIHFEEGDVDYIYDPYNIYSSTAAKQYMIVSVQRLVNSVVLSYPQPIILKTEKEEYDEYITLKTPYWDNPCESLEYEQEMLFRECLTTVDTYEAKIDRIMRESFKLKTRAIKNNHKVTNVVKKK